MALPVVSATILNVNDREPNRYAVTRTLRAAGFTVIEAADGASALREVEAHPPDLVVLDVNLPDMSGLQVARALKTAAETKHVLILQVSAISVFAHHRAEGLEGGADAYLTEPFEPNELIATIRALLRLGRAEAAAREAAAQWQATFDALSAGLAVCDADGRIRVHNAALRELLGEKVARGRLLADVFEDGRGAVEAAIVEVSAAPGRKQLELVDRGRTWGITVTSSQRSPAARPAPAAASNDVTVSVDELTALRRADAALKLLSDTGPMLMASLDFEQTLKQVAATPVPLLADFCLLDLQDGMGATLRRVAASGAEGDDGLPRELEKLTPDPSHPDLIVERAFFRGEPSILPRMGAGDLERLTRNPQHRNVLERLAPSSLLCVPLEISGKPIGAMTLVTNGSDRHYSKEDLLLAQELAARAALAVENAKLHRDARAALHTRDEFFSIASHELKNPLAALMLQLKLLQRELRRSSNRPAPPEVIAAKVDAAERNAGRIGELVQELLDTTRIRAGKLELRRELIDLGIMVRDAVTRIEPEAQQAKTAISVQTIADVTGWWDRSRLEQVIVNLLTNAVKYGSGQPISVSVSRADGAACFVVHDGGIGVPAEDQERIFEAFERGKSLEGSKMTGLGLGLYISRKIVEAHGGKITLKSEPGYGSTFTVKLPPGTPLTSEATGG